MGKQQKIRNYINQKFVEKNSILVNEMRNYNRVYGRNKSVWGRAKLVGKLYWNYEVRKKHPIELREKRFAKQSFPESAITKQISKNEVWEIARDVDIVVFDFFDVLFNVALQEEQLLAVFEVVSGHLGIYETIKSDNQIPDKDIWEQIVMDFTIKNEFMSEVWFEAKSKGIPVSIRNNSNIYDDNLVKKIIQLYGYDGELYIGEGKAAFITTVPKKKNDIYYKNVNIIGNAFRPFLQNSVITELYNQIVNSKLHDGKGAYSLFYEYGFVCGGILTCGFCQYLNGLAEREHIDKFIFVARDGDIIKKIYEKYFKTRNYGYLTFSRFASYELIFEDFPEEYIDKNIKARMFREKSDNSIKKILQECHLEFMERHIQEEGLCIENKLDMGNYENLKKILLKYKTEIQKSFQETCDAAKQYILQQVDGYRKICIVDVGWHGKSIVYLKHLLEKKYMWHGNVFGAMVGATSDEVTQNYIRSGLINTYAFENAYWRRMGRYNGECMLDNEIICIEALFSSEADTLLRYQFGVDRNIQFIYGKRNRNKENIKLAHQGIMDFAERIVPVLKKYHLTITSRDAYIPLDYIIRNKKFLEEVCQVYDEVPNAINGFGEE